MRNLLLLLLLILLKDEKLLAQKLPLKISLFNEATAIPFTKFFTKPIHPGIQIGTEINYKNKQKIRFYQTGNLCYFYHNKLNQGIGIYSEFGSEIKILKKLSLSGLIGLGYMHTFATGEEFTFSNGTYLKKPDKGNPRLFPSVSLELNYSLNKTIENGPSIFMQYQSWIEYPYSPGFIPLMTHINLHIGTKFYINKK